MNQMLWCPFPVSRQSHNAHPPHIRSVRYAVCCIARGIGVMSLKRCAFKFGEARFWRCGHADGHQHAISSSIAEGLFCKVGVARAR